MPEAKDILKELAKKTTKLQETSKETLERMKRLTEAAQILSKTPPGKKG